MTLDAKAKEYVLGHLRTAIDDLQNQGFDGLRKLTNRLVTIGEAFPDENWTKEFSIMALTFIVIGASTEQDMPKLKQERKDQITKIYAEKLKAVYTAIEEEDIGKIDSLLKDFALLFFKEIG